MAKNTKTSNASKKKVVTKTVSRSQNPWLLGLAALVIAAVLTVIGMAAYNKYKENDLKAKAGSYGTIYSKDGFTMKACRTYNTAARQYIVTVIGSKPADWGPGMASLSADSIAKTTDEKLYSRSNASFSWYGGVVTAIKVVVPINGSYRAGIAKDAFDRSHLSPWVNINFTPGC